MGAGASAAGVKMAASQASVDEIKGLISDMPEELKQTLKDMPEELKQKLMDAMSEKPAEVSPPEAETTENKTNTNLKFFALHGGRDVCKIEAVEERGILVPQLEAILMFLKRLCCKDGFIRDLCRP